MSTELYMLIGVVVFVVAFRLWWRAVDRRHARESAAQAAREHLTNLHARSDWDEVTWHRRRGGSQLPGPLDDAPKPPAWTTRSPEEVWVEAHRDTNMPEPPSPQAAGATSGARVPARRTTTLRAATLGRRATRRGLARPETETLSKRTDRPGIVRS